VLGRDARIGGRGRPYGIAAARRAARSIEEEPHGIVITTTDIHLPRRIGEAVKRAFHGEIEDRFEKDGDFVRVT
jgi:hypothetical protein